MNNSGEVTLINLLNKKISRRLRLHGMPRAGAVTSDSRLLALPVSGNGDLFIFDMKSLTVKERIVELPSDLGDTSLAVFSGNEWVETHIRYAATANQYIVCQLHTHPDQTGCQFRPRTGFRS
jgi:hypothetical protein